jgi:hypothetical protein
MSNKMKNENDISTPETDENEYSATTFRDAPHTVRLVHANLARKLESERNEARRLAERFAANHDVIFNWMNEKSAFIDSQRNDHD